jgi:excisionase family DNA binding protein
MSTIVDNTREYLKREEAAKIVRVAPQTLAKWASERVHLPFIKVGRHVRYRLSDLQDWLAKQTVQVD